MLRKASARVPLALAIAEAIRRIPRGKVSTYGAVAKAAGYPRCARHVSKVLQQVPDLAWQRVLGSGGRISLKGEYALEQRFLLQAEGVRWKGSHVDMAVFEYQFPGKANSTKVVPGGRLPRKS
jgi:methylated-DNA-protein-cysteine methyltransferase related protein